MKLLKRNQGEFYDAKAHFNCWSLMKLRPDIETKRLSVGVTHFLPHGGTEMKASPLDRIYYLVSGKLLVKSKTGEEFMMEPGDVLYIPPGEEREVRGVPPDVGTILVIMCKAE